MTTLNEMEKHSTLVRAALIDANNFAGYSKDWVDGAVADRVKAIFPDCDLRTPQGRKLMYKFIEQDNGYTLRYNTIGVGKKLYSAIVLCLLEKD